MWTLVHWMFGRVGALQHLIERRFTAGGLLVGSAMIATAALGVDTNLTVAYRIFALSAALLLVAAIAMWLQRGRFTVERQLPRVVTAGDAFHYRVTVASLANAPRDGLTLIEDLADPRPGLAEFRARVRLPTYRAWRRLVNERRTCQVAALGVPALPPRGRTELMLRGEALRRGNQHFTGLTVARADPLGLLRGLSCLAAPANMMVLPRRYALPPIALPGSRRYQHGGVALAASIGDSEEFIGLRDYRPGDPLQRIHWKSFARTGEPVVREFQDEYFERHALILDTFTGGAPDPSQAAAFEEAVSIAASFACTVNTQECLLDLMFVGNQSYLYTAGRGQLSTGSLLEVLASVELSAAQPFRTLHEAVLARRHMLSGSICILLAWDEPRREFIHTLRAQGVPVLVLVVTSEAVAEQAPWLHVLAPGQVQAGLARL